MFSTIGALCELACIIVNLAGDSDIFHCASNTIKNTIEMSNEILNELTSLRKANYNILIRNGKLKQSAFWCARASVCVGV